jgi:hypothetical protein
VSEQTRRARAIQRAISLGLAGGVQRVRFGWYRLPSTTRPGVWWTVRVSADGRWSCDCEAGRAGRPCVHQAAVYIRKVQAGGGTVVAPAPAPTPAPPAASNVVALPRRAA